MTGMKTNSRCSGRAPAIGYVTRPSSEFTRAMTLGEMRRNLPFGCAG